MINKKFTITFRTGEVEEVYALCAKEAEIVAQARQIQKGNRYDVATIEWEDDPLY